jgi:hypothetical protein
MDGVYKRGGEAPQDHPCPCVRSWLQVRNLKAIYHYAFTAGTPFQGPRALSRTPKHRVVNNPHSHPTILGANSFLAHSNNMQPRTQTTSPRMAVVSPQSEVLKAKYVLSLLARPETPRHANSQILHPYVGKL